MRRSIPTALLLASLSLGCAVSPQPEPVWHPLVDFDLRLIALTVEGTQVRALGSPGAVSPGMGDLVVVDLDASGPAAQAAVAADGSFDVRVDAAQSDVLRLVVRTGDGWSEPIDVTHGARETLRVDFRSGDCTTRIPASSVQFGGLLGAMGPVAGLALENGCATAVRIVTLELRAGDTGFAVDPSALPLTLAASETTTIDVRFAPPSAGLFTDVLFVGVEGAPEPIPVSLLGSGPPP